eukprot:TRINITY_DN4715_c0_g1_i6.p1 TRINITY_DN4715_c0_g1~~TRINITY_DN4715_c0_g1_i6.p1  ORF type:complete len:885 (+),score=166.80 TRINITY_DN4715_c0_g1_i6:81-2657(+)
MGKEEVLIFPNNEVNPKKILGGRLLVKDEKPVKRGTKDWELWQPVTKIDERDADTKDKWIPRHPDLIRLTGRHPFNSEPPHLDLMAAGFITPASLHFVRNHGACPQLTWENHRIEVNGLVETPLSVSMDDLVQMETITRAVTLVCCGNRRKEVNMIAKSKGFSWGPSATSTNNWTGVPMRILLKAAGVKPPYVNRWVCFRGPLGELPAGKDGSYGTSMTLAYAMDPANDVMIAYLQNGRYLHPDHGFPVRIVIPGWIGGRMIKWLSEISVTDHESTNHYHYYDNKILPPFVDAELADKEGWWFKPEFILYDLNINSTISRPAHDETILLEQNETYTMEGYAYSGGGRKINRVEVSLDEGKTWRLAELNITEKPNPQGKYWCWCFWSLKVNNLDLLSATEIVCRAYDYSQNTQPYHLAWSLLGQGNNCMFKLLVHKEQDENGRLCIRFQQPAPMEAGSKGNYGWLEEEKKAKDAVALPPTPPPQEKKVEVKTFTMAEVEKHADEKSAWFVVDGKVYDGTSYLQDHPGGADSIILNSGIDASDEFNSIHSQKAKAMLVDYFIGDLVSEGSSTSSVSSATASRVDLDVAANVEQAEKSEVQQIALDPRKKIAFPLSEKIVINHNTAIFRFALQSSKHKFGLPVGKHIWLYAQIDGKMVMRAYTPTSSDDDLGYFDLLVKIYRPLPPKFPRGGLMSQHLDTLKIGDTIDVKGPLGDFIYLGKGQYSYKNQEYPTKQISMIAGGTGITPMYQVIKAIIKDKKDKTKMALLYANQTEEDILLREELDELALKYPNLKVHYTLDRPSEGWRYSKGFITEQMIRDNLFKPTKGSIVLMCGPPPMLEYACYPNLEKIGFAKDAMMTF